MANQIFAVILDEPNEVVKRRIEQRIEEAKDKYLRWHPHTDRLYLVLVDQTMLTRDVAEEIGVRRTEEGDAEPMGKGVVFKLNGAFAGFSKSSLWEWLNGVRESAL